MATIRLDYHGTGESLGSDRDPGRPAAWIASVHHAIDALESVPGVTSVSLVGMRMGATLAAAAAEHRSVESLVLWEPCLGGAAYTRELEIISAATRKALADGGSGAPAEAPSDGSIEAAGYVLTPGTVEELAGLRMPSLEVRGTPRVLVIRRDDRPAIGKIADPFARRGCETDEITMPGFKEMMVYPLRSVPPRDTLHRIREWVVAGAPGGSGSPPPAADVLESSVVEDGVEHRAVRFGPRERLFGVLSSGASGEQRRVPVLLLAGGLVPRTAVNRMYVDLAHRLAAAGHDVLRFDVSGIAESDPAPGMPFNNAYPDVQLDDVADAVGLLTGGDAEQPVWLLGLCSGAYGAWQHALSDHRVAGLTLINPIEYYPRHGLSFANETDAGPGGGDSRPSANGGVRNRVAGGLRSVSARVARRPGRLRKDLKRLLARGTLVDLAFAQGDPGVPVLETALGASLDGVDAPGVRVAVYPGSDHAFNPMAPRARLLDWVTEGVSRGAGLTERDRPQPTTS